MDQLLTKHGYRLLPSICSIAECRKYSAALASLDRAGNRQLLSIPNIARLANSARLLNAVRSHLPGEPRVVRAIYFDKSPEVNWLVPWHQDLTIAVQQKREVEGYGPWSIK